MKSKEVISLLGNKRKGIYANPDSVLKRYEDFLTMKGVYYSNDPMTFRNSIKGKLDLCDGMIEFYEAAKLPNEKISLLNDLYASGYDRDKIIQMVFKLFEENREFEYLWECGDLLYRIKKHKYLPRYIQIIKDDTYGTARQMVILLAGKSKKTEVIPILKELLKDSDVEGHALQALANFENDEIKEIMQCYCNHKITWIRNIAKSYLAI